MIPGAARARMERNGAATLAAQAEGDASPDHRPVIRVERGRCVWLLSELIPDPEGDYAGPVAFGLCDLGMGFPELGTVFVHELEEVGARVVEGWTAAGTLTQYADAANRAERIVDLSPAPSRCGCGADLPRWAAPGALCAECFDEWDI